MSRRAVTVLVAACALPVLFAGIAAAQQTTMVPVTIEGKTVRLEMRIYKPDTVARVPTLVFNHGSSSIDAPDIGAFFLRRGWAVVIPARRGRGGSEGDHKEGFGFARTFVYSCERATSIIGAETALTDIGASMDAITALPFVDPGRVVMGGVSRGGILSVAYAGRQPRQLRGVINFAGGWLGTGCPTATNVNTSLFKLGTPFPTETLWLYADRDSFYALAHSRENFAAFQAAGGKGTFLDFEVPGADGQALVTRPEVWGPAVAAYLERLALPSVERARP